MSSPEDLFERVRAANPVPSEVEPDWDRVRDLLTAADGRAEEAADRRERPSARRWRSSRRAAILAGVAVCGVLAFAGVLALEPDGGSSDFLARAAAALSTGRGTVLYERWEETLEPEAGNPQRTRAVTFGPEQLWIQGGHPRRYRTLLMPRRPPAAEPAGGARLAYAYGVNLASSGSGVHFHRGTIDPLRRLSRSIEGRPLELGGSVEAPSGTTQPGATRPTLTLMSSKELLRARLRVTLGPELPGPHDTAIENGADPVSALRAAIAEGRAHAAGSTLLSGRTVERINFDLPGSLPADAPPLPPDHPVTHADAYALVERGTFYPVLIVFGGETYRFLSYTYLPATRSNLALTDIRALHPRARILDVVFHSGQHPGP